jgi:hypothetical protein
MLEKLFARLRSRRQSDLATAPAAAPIRSLSTPIPSGAVPGTLAGPLTPPPLPADAWAESESGIVITDSGIIILDPAPAPRKPSIPELPPAQPQAAKRSLTPGELDWDDVLARARARAEVAAPPPRRPAATPPLPKRPPARAKAK